MNATAEDADTSPEDQTPAIVIVAIEEKLFYLLKGDEFLNELLLVDGKFPKPVLCLCFESVFSAKTVVGADFNPSQYWNIHPDIVERLRTTECLVETYA